MAGGAAAAAGRAHMALLSCEAGTGFLIHSISWLMVTQNTSPLSRV